MPFKKTNDHQLSRDDIVRALDTEEENLSADVLSKLRQNRYAAIDHAGIIDKRDFFREAIGWSFAAVASVAVAVFMFNNHHIIDKQARITVADFIKEKGGLESDVHRLLGVSAEDQITNKVKADPESLPGISNEPSNNDENNNLEELEDLEIYEWLYNNYG